MKCREIIQKIEEWAPHQIAWDRDNTGLQVGSVEREVKNILLSLDLTETVIEQALQKNCNLIITHHPLLFNPLKKIDTLKDKRAILIEKLIKNNITLYTCHTNLDYTRDGVSFELARRLGLENIRFLSELKSNQSKLVIYVPADSVDKVSEAVFTNGGGIIGEYTECSFRTSGKGTFRGSKKSNPAVGEKEISETVDEIKIEIVVDNWKLHKILSRIIEVHPYEEPVYDIYPLNTSNRNFGAGALGELSGKKTPGEFLAYASEKLGIKNFRYSEGTVNNIKTVAVCGGSGSEYINDAIISGAQAFITSDIKYHSFQEAEEKILLLDAGHYETEIFSLDAVERYLSENSNEIGIYKVTDNLNPVKFFNNQGAK